MLEQKSIEINSNCYFIRFSSFNICVRCACCFSLFSFTLSLSLFILLNIFLQIVCRAICLHQTEVWDNNAPEGATTKKWMAHWKWMNAQSECSSWTKQIRKIHSGEVYAHPFVHTNRVRPSLSTSGRCACLCVGCSLRQLRNCGGTAGQTTLGNELRRAQQQRQRLVSLFRFIFYCSPRRLKWSTICPYL